MESSGVVVPPVEVIFNFLNLVRKFAEDICLIVIAFLIVNNVRREEEEEEIDWSHCRKGACFTAV